LVVGVAGVELVYFTADQLEGSEQVYLGERRGEALDVRGGKIKIYEKKFLGEGFVYFEP